MQVEIYNNLLIRFGRHPGFSGVAVAPGYLPVGPAKAGLHPPKAGKPSAWLTL